MAETFNLGQVAPISKGNYASETQYKVLNTVYASGGTWMCIKPAIGIEPGISPNWQQYWIPVAKGLLRIAVSNAGTGLVSITFYYSDGTSANYIFSSSALSPNSVGTAELKNNSISEDKMQSNSVGYKALQFNCVSKDILTPEVRTEIEGKAPGYTVSSSALNPGSSSLATGTLWIQYE